MTTTLNLKASVLALALTSIYPVISSAATSAGVAQFVSGDVNVRRLDGQSSPLVKGKDIESGQAIVTGITGRAQVRFSDGGLVSLQPNTEFKIASYVDQADQQQDRFLVDLLRGSMRAITGLIGKRNKDNYRVTTTTATIGIRGSGFTAGYNTDGSLTVTAEKDAIEVCSGGVCVGLVAGESATVKSSTEPPARTSNRASIPTPGPAQEVVTIGNQTNADGSSSLITDVTFRDVGVVAVTSDAGGSYPEFISSGQPTSAVFRNNKLVRFSDETNATYVETGTPQPAENFKSIGKASDPEFVGWGMWLKATKTYNGSTEQLDNFHYVAGRPTSPADMTAFMNCYYCTYSYTLIGSTAPTQNSAVGILNSATLSVTTRISNYSLNAYIDTSFGTYNGNSTLGTGASFGNAYFKGSFFGSNAGIAGLTYGFDPGTGTVKGALVFQKPASYNNNNY